MRLASKKHPHAPVSVAPAVQRLPLTKRPSHAPLWAGAMPVQLSLKINAPGDRYEQEADRVADQVMRMPTAQVQRKTCSSCGRPAGPGGMCDDCGRDQLGIQRMSSGGAPQTTAPPIVHQVLRQPGRPLESSTRSFMESRFGADFSQVRVHTNSHAAESAKTLDAHAYTVGNNIVFGDGRSTSHDLSSRKLLAHELTHTLQQANLGHGIQRKPSAPAPAKDPLCDSFSFNVTKGLIASQTGAYAADKSDTAVRLSLVRTLKLIHRCATTEQQEEIRTDLTGIVGKSDMESLWKEAGTAFGGYVGLYPGYAGDIKRRLGSLGASETLKFSSFKFSSTGSGSAHKRGATKQAGKEVADLLRTDIVYFRGHQFAQYQAPGVFSNGAETYGFDLRYIARAGGFPNVKLMISTSCATLCKEAIELFSSLFPNAVILGYRKSAPLDGRGVRASFQTKIQALSRPLLLDQAIDINAIISVWKSVIEQKHAGHTRQLPGYYKNGTVHYWDGAAWQQIKPSDAANKCRRKGDFRGQYPAP